MLIVGINLHIKSLMELPARLSSDYLNGQCVDLHSPTISFQGVAC
jgi:hypothetical protein